MKEKGLKFGGREVKRVKDDNREFCAESTFKNASMKYSSKYCYDSFPFPNFRAFFLSKVSGSEANVFTWRVDLLGIVEHNETISINNSNSRVMFNGGKDTWTPVAVSTFTKDGVNVTNMTTTLKSGAVEIGLSGYLADGVVNLVDGTQLAANAMKYSISIKNFPYTLSKSRLALVHRILAKSKSQKNSSSLLSVGTGGSLEWVTKAMFGTSSLNVDAAIIDYTMPPPPKDSDDGGKKDMNKFDGESAVFVGFTFGDFGSTPSQLFWDPGVTVNEEALISTSGTGAASSVQSPLATVFALFGLGVLVA